ncbi:MAG: hypothetical protein WDW36_008083 [Sanguina aurantia]
MLTPPPSQAIVNGNPAVLGSNTNAQPPPRTPLPTSIAWALPSIPSQRQSITSTPPTLRAAYAPPPFQPQPSNPTLATHTNHNSSSSRYRSGPESLQLLLDEHSSWLASFRQQMGGASQSDSTGVGAHAPGFLGPGLQLNSGGLGLNPNTPQALPERGGGGGSYEGREHPGSGLGVEFGSGLFGGASLELAAGAGRRGHQRL